MALDETGGTAEGEVLGGTISDDMIALEQLTSQAPLAPRAVATPGAAGQSADNDDEQPSAAGDLPPAAPPPAAAAPAGE